MPANEGAGAALPAGVGGGETSKVTEAEAGDTIASATGSASGSASGLRALCVSIHDVAPATWDECARIAAAIREVADIPLTWLVVPHYHRAGGDQARMEAGLERALAAGDELALHGFTHLDTAPGGSGLRERFLRGTYSIEGEFAALGAAEAARRIGLGLDWFAERGWPVRGFVPPAWLMGEGAWEALRSFDFDYTTTFRRFHLLRHPGTGAAPEEPPAATGMFMPPFAERSLRVPPARSAMSSPSPSPSLTPMPPSLLSPSLVYAARNRSGRMASPLLADLLAFALAGQPLVRLGLHPPDVRYPRLLRHAQATVERLLATRTALTKAAFAQLLLTSKGPRTHHRASGANLPRHRTTDCCRSGAALRAY